MHKFHQKNWKLKFKELEINIMKIRDCKQLDCFWRVQTNRVLIKFMAFLYYFMHFASILKFLEQILSTCWKIKLKSGELFYPWTTFDSPTSYFQNQESWDKKDPGPSCDGSGFRTVKDAGQKIFFESVHLHNGSGRRPLKILLKRREADIGRRRTRFTYELWSEWTYWFRQVSSMVFCWKMLRSIVSLEIRMKF